MKKILLICLTALFALIFISCDLNGDTEGTTVSANSTENEFPVFETTTTEENTDPSVPNDQTTANNTTSDNKVVLDPTKPSRETAQKIELFMTYAEIVNMLGQEGRYIVTSTPKKEYEWMLSDGSVLTIRFVKPRNAKDPHNYDIEHDRVAIGAWIGNDYLFKFVELFDGSAFSGLSYNEVIALINDPNEKTNDNGTLICKWYYCSTRYDLVLFFDENMHVKEWTYDITYFSIFTSAQDKGLIVGGEFSALIDKKEIYKYLTVLPEYDQETGLNRYKWSILFWGGELFVWVDDEQKIVKFKIDWINGMDAETIKTDMRYSEVVGLIGEPKHITEDGICQWDVVEAPYKTLSVKFAENADGILVVSEVKQD